MAKSNNSAAEYEATNQDYAMTKDSLHTDHTLTSRARIRSQMQDDIEAFIERGGHVEKVPKNLRSDPPKKPQSNYGSRPI